MRFLSRPRGIIGLTFGDDAIAAAARLSLRQEWLPWEGNEGFETCSDIASPVQAFGGQANVRLVRKDGKLVAVELTIPGCSEQWERLRKAVAEEFHLRDSAAPDLYEVWTGGEFVHLARDERYDACVLTVGDKQFGNAYRSYELHLGLGALGNSMRPH
jgi:hypothetical protein